MGVPGPSKQAIRDSLRALLSDAGAGPLHIRETRSIEGGRTHVDMAIGEERRSVVSDSQDVARFELAQYLAEEDLIAYLMSLPESDRRDRDRKLLWKTAKKPCPNECEGGKVQVMDGWMRCEVCHGKGWVI